MNPEGFLADVGQAPAGLAGPAVRHRHDGDPAVLLLAEVTVAELVAAHWWSDDQGRVVGGVRRR